MLKLHSKRPGRLLIEDTIFPNPVQCCLQRSVLFVTFRSPEIRMCALSNVMLPLQLLSHSLGLQALPAHCPLNTNAYAFCAAIAAAAALQQEAVALDAYNDWLLAVRRQPSTPV